MGSPRVKVATRWRDDQIELQCPTCREWWPGAKEFWSLSHGMTRCAACWREYKRLHEAGRMADEINREIRRSANRARYLMNKANKLAANKRWRDANRDHVKAYNAAYRESHKEVLRERRRAYEAECRDVILWKKREAYVEKKIRDARAA